MQDFDSTISKISSELNLSENSIRRLSDKRKMITELAQQLKDTDAEIYKIKKNIESVHSETVEKFKQDLVHRLNAEVKLFSDRHVLLASEEFEKETENLRQTRYELELRIDVLNSFVLASMLQEMLVEHR